MRPDASSSPPPVPTGVAHRPAGQAWARERVAVYVGFTPAVPNLAAARKVLLAGAREIGLGPSPLRTLTVLLGAVPAYRWRGSLSPVLQLRNRRLAAEAGCSVRTLQRHLRRLHELGLIAISWGPGNMRLSFGEDRRGGDEPVGIDLRPALVVAGELAARLRAREASRSAFEAAYADAGEAILAARGAVDAAATLLAVARKAHRARLDELRRHLRAAVHPAYRPAATAAQIDDATAMATALAAEAEALRRALAHPPGPDGGGEGRRPGDAAGDSSADPSPGHDGGRTQQTESTNVEPYVRTNQREGRTASKGWGSSDGDDDPAEALLLARWRRDHDGTAPLGSGDRAELEIATRQRASRMGVGTAAYNAGVERHGLGLTIGAVLHVGALPERAGVRSKGGLLVSLLRRPAGQLTPETFHRRPPADLELGEGEALRIARQLAPSHQPDWVMRRWTATRLRRGEPIHDPRRCLAAFARKLEREQGRAA
jgi:hypothetical protein